MKRIMKTLGIVTIVALLLSGGAVVPVSATPEVIVSIDAANEAAPDSDFTANVNIGEVTNFDACNYDVSFDASVLRLDNVTSGLIGSTTIPVNVYNEISLGTYRIIHNVPGLSGVSGSGYLAVLYFHVIGTNGDSSAISLSNSMLSNNLAEEIPATWVGDTVDVVTPPVAVSIDAPDEAAPDSDFTANVNIGEVTDLDASNYDVSFDASVLRLDNVTSGMIGSTTIPVDVYNEINSGTYRIIHNVPGLSGVSGSGYLAVLHFHVIGTNGDSSTISLSNGVLSNILAEEIPTTWVGDTVDVVTPPVAVSIDAPDEAAPDSDFTANVNISEVTNFDACNYDVSFDASVLRLDNVTSGLIASTTIPVDMYNEISSGIWRVIQNVPGLTGASGSGYLAVLHFHVIGSNGDTSTISLSNGMLSNLTEEIPATWTEDSVSVSDTGSPSVTITPLAPDPTNDKTPTFNGTATDTSSNISSVEYKVDDGGWIAATASDGTFDSLSEGYSFTIAALSNGAHTVYVRATDSATNTTAEANYASDSFAVDTGPPSVTITALTPDPTNDNTPTFTGTATDTLSNISSVEYKVDDGSWTAATASDGALDSLSEGYTFTTAALSDGAHTLYVRATDAATNTTAEADYASDSFTVQTVIPGDANGDGNVNSLDIIKVERIIAGLDTQTPGADANQDGNINALDINKIERIIAGLD